MIQSYRDHEADATGHFSWRANHHGAGSGLTPSSTVQALPSGGASPSPARGPWAKTGMARARLAGISFGSPSPLQVGLKLPGLAQTLSAVSASMAHLWAQVCSPPACPRLLCTGHTLSALSCFVDFGALAAELHIEPSSHCR